MLRERCGITSLKDGCSPQGQCGCCVALVDGKPKTTCAMPARVADGKHVVTLDGLPDAERQQIADCFTATAGLQCGFCIPGIALRAKALTDRDPAPTREAIASALDGHLCRCTGYVKIIDAIELLAAAKPAARPSRRPAATAASASRWRASAARRRCWASGPSSATSRCRACCTARSCCRRIRAPACCASTPRGPARCRACDVVATAADVPGERWYGLLHNDWPGFVAEGEEMRYVGDVLAAVAAVDRHTARAAAELVDVSYEVLPPTLDPLQALEPGAPPGQPAARQPAGPLGGAARRRRRRAGRQRARGQRHWPTQRIEHLFLEPESALAEPLPDGRLAPAHAGPGHLRRPPAGGALPGHARSRRSSSSWSPTAALSAARRT